MLRTTDSTRRVNGVPAPGRAAPPADLKPDADADAERRAAKVRLVELAGDAAAAEAVRHPAESRLGANLQELPDRHVDAAHRVVGEGPIADLTVLVGFAVADRADAATGEPGEGRRDHAGASPVHLVEPVTCRHLDRPQADGQRDAEREHLAFVHERALAG